MLLSRITLLMAVVVAAALQTAPVSAQEAGAPASAEMPREITFVFQRQKDPTQVREHAERVAAYIAERIGVPVRVQIPASYGASVQALVSKRADVAYLSSIPYLMARAEVPMEIVVVERRGERTDYDSIFVVAKDSPIQSLEDLRGKRMMFTSATSTSGYVMAYSRLVDEGFLEPGQDPAAFFGSVNFAGGYDRALMAVANGQADACAVSDYTMIGPTADVYLTAEQRAKLRVLTATPGVPTHLIAARTELPAELRAKLREALLELSREHPELLADVYGAAELVATEGDDHVAGAVKALENTKLGAAGLVQ